jgi:hypothetical protein
MQNRRRDLLHRDRLHEFRLWAARNGYVIEPTKGAFEVLRVREAGGGAPIIFHERGSNTSGNGDGSDHITATGKGVRMVLDFLHDTRPPRA